MPLNKSNDLIDSSLLLFFNPPDTSSGSCVKVDGVLDLSRRYAKPKRWLFAQLPKVARDEDR